MPDTYELVADPAPAAPTAEHQEEASRARAFKGWRPSAREFITWLLVLVGALIALAYGLQLRRWAWDTTEPIRFQWDVKNAIRWGTRANEVGVVNLYSKVIEEGGVQGHMGLDYAPLRLFIVSRWTKWSAETFPDGATWQNRYDYHAPMLWVNTACEIASAVAVFLIVRLWLRRAAAAKLGGDERVPGELGLLPGFVAAMLFWFNPAVILDAHCWPQWDVWVLPFFLWAVYLASIDCWLLAGAVIGFGCMGKGQVLLVAPVLLMWPAFQGRLLAVVRFVIGLALGAAVVVWPWLVREPGGRPWVAGAFVAGLLLVPLYYNRERTPRKLAGHAALGLLALALVLWPWLLDSTKPGFFIAFAAGLLVVVGSRFLPRRAAPYWLAFSLAAWFALAVPLFAGSLDWLWVGFGYPTYHYPAMNMGPVSNIPSLMRARWGWNLHDPLFTPSPEGWLTWAPTVKQVSVFVFGLALLWCGVAAAVLDRRRSSLTLLALVTPWVVFFAVLVQMHERYFVFAAGATAVLVAIGPRGLLLHVLVTAIAAIHVGHALTSQNAGFAPSWHKFLAGTHPDIGWLVGGIAAVMMWMVVAGIRRPSPDKPAG